MVENDLIKDSSEFPLSQVKERQLTIWEAFGEEEPPPPENLTFSVNCIDDWPLVSHKTNRNKSLNPIVTKANGLHVTAPPGYYRTEDRAYGSFVGEQEWKLFIVLRRMALEYGGYELNGNFSLSFTLRELCRFYKKSTGKVVNHGVMKRRLEILRTAVYQIKDKNQAAHFSLLRELYITSKNDLEKDGNSKCYLMFDHLTEKTLTTGRGILIDYDLACKLPHIASWFYSKLERAGLETGLQPEVPYKLWLKNTLYRIGLDNSSKTINKLKKETIQALIKLIEIGVLKKFKFEDKLTSGRGRPSLIDSEIYLEITREFQMRIRAKLSSTKLLRAGTSNKIQLKSSYPNSPTKLKKLTAIKKSSSEYAGHYEREDDRRTEDLTPPTEAEFRSEKDRRSS